MMLWRWWEWTRAVKFWQVKTGSWTDLQIWETICVVITKIDPIYTVTLFFKFLCLHSGNEWHLNLSAGDKLPVTTTSSTTEAWSWQSRRKTCHAEIIRRLPPDPWWWGALARGWPWEWRRPCIPWRGRSQSARPASDSLLLAWQPYQEQHCWGGTVSCRRGGSLFIWVFLWRFSHLRGYDVVLRLHVSIHHFAGVICRVFKVLQVGLHLT